MRRQLSVGFLMKYQKERGEMREMILRIDDDHKFSCAISNCSLTDVLGMLKFASLHADELARPYAIVAVRKGEYDPPLPEAPDAS
jgi:hypothetical protein